MISIILSTFNDERTIFYSIKSILGQTYSNFELIIINDFSTDKTKQIIKSFNDSRIIYIENEYNIGRSLSRNKGIKKSKGDFIAIIDGLRNLTSIIPTKVFFKRANILSSGSKGEFYWDAEYSGRQKNNTELFLEYVVPKSFKIN